MISTSRPLAVDLFAGAGGMSLGFEQAGFDVVSAVELDPIHAATHLYNFPAAKVIARSVCDVNAEDVVTLSDHKSRKVSVVFGGAPCQGFSMIGQRVLDDPRNSLVNEFMRLVVELESDYFVFENVKGLTVGAHKQFLHELMLRFRANGYVIVEPWRVLNAKDYGVPQDRERLFLLGAKRGLPLPGYPLPSHARGEGDLYESRLPFVTCKEALGDLPDVESFDTLTQSDEVELSEWNPISSYARQLHLCDNDGWYLGYRRSWNPLLLTSSLRTDHTPESRERFKDYPCGGVEPVSRFFKLHPDGQSNTLRAGTDSSRGAFTSPRPIHYAYARCVTVREMARLHGYPDWFRFHSTKWHGARQVGNSVPPPLARAVANSVKKVIPNAVNAPEINLEKLKLNDARLLRMDMSEASEYWGVVNPIGGRNKKKVDMLTA